MSFLQAMFDGARQIRADMSGTPAPWDDFWYQPIGSRSSTGIRVSPDSAKQISAVLACVNKIAKTLAMVPLKIYTDTKGGGKEVAANHPLYDVLYSQPNDYQTAFEWRQMMQGHLELRGNAYSEIIPGKRRAIDQLVPMHPERVHPEQLQSGRIRYRYNDPLTGSDRLLAQEQVFHLRNFMDNGIMGQSTVAMATDTLGLALAAQDNYARFLKNDSRSQSVLVGAKFKTVQDEQAFRENWQQQHTGENRYKVSVLPPGLDIKSIGVSSRDAELLDARKFSRIEICSIFDCPPHLIGETERTASYASVEQFNIMFVTFCILPRAVLWEQAIQRSLIFQKSYFPKFSLGAILRGDTAARFGAYKVAIENGWMNQDEVRIEEDLNPIADGNGTHYWRPLNWARLEDVHTSVQPKNPGAPDDETEQEQTTDSTTARLDERFKMLLRAGAERCIAKERGAVQRMIEKGSTGEELRDFYRHHADFLAKVLKISLDKARAYCERRAANLALPDNDASIAELIALVLGGIQ
jgi:HK97 family phage portal protein